MFPPIQPNLLDIPLPIMPLDNPTFSDPADMVQEKIASIVESMDHQAIRFFLNCMAQGQAEGVMKFLGLDQLQGFSSTPDMQQNQRIVRDNHIELQNFVMLTKDTYEQPQNPSFLAENSCIPPQNSMIRTCMPQNFGESLQNRPQMPQTRGMVYITPSNRFLNPNMPLIRPINPCEQTQNYFRMPENHSTPDQNSSNLLSNYDFRHSGPQNMQQKLNPSAKTPSNSPSKLPLLGRKRKNQTTFQKSAENRKISSHSPPKFRKNYDAEKDLKKPIHVPSKKSKEEKEPIQESVNRMVNALFMFMHEQIKEVKVSNELIELDPFDSRGLYQIGLKKNKLEELKQQQGDPDGKMPKEIDLLQPEAIPFDGFQRRQEPKNPPDDVTTESERSLGLSEASNEHKNQEFTPKNTPDRTQSTFMPNGQPHLFSSLSNSPKNHDIPTNPPPQNSMVPTPMNVPQNSMNWRNLMPPSHLPSETPNGRQNSEIASKDHHDHPSRFSSLDGQPRMTSNNSYELQKLPQDVQNGRRKSHAPHGMPNIPQMAYHARLPMPSNHQIPSLPPLNNPQDGNSQDTMPNQPPRGPMPSNYHPFLSRQQVITLQNHGPCQGSYDHQDVSSLQGPTGMPPHPSMMNNHANNIPRIVQNHHMPSNGLQNRNFGSYIVHPMPHHKMNYSVPGGMAMDGSVPLPPPHHRAYLNAPNGQAQLQNEPIPPASGSMPTYHGPIPLEMVLDGPRSYTNGDMRYPCGNTRFPCAPSDPYRPGMLLDTSGSTPPGNGPMLRPNGTKNSMSLRSSLKSFIPTQNVHNGHMFTANFLSDPLLRQNGSDSPMPLPNNTRQTQPSTGSIPVPNISNSKPPGHERSNDSITFSDGLNGSIRQQVDQTTLHDHPNEDMRHSTNPNGMVPLRNRSNTSTALHRDPDQAVAGRNSPCKSTSPPNDSNQSPNGSLPTTNPSKRSIDILKRILVLDNDYRCKPEREKELKELRRQLPADFFPAKLFDLFLELSSPTSLNDLPVQRSTSSIDRFQDLSADIPVLPPNFATIAQKISLNIVNSAEGKDEPLLMPKDQFEDATKTQENTKGPKNFEMLSKNGETSRCNERELKEKIPEEDPNMDKSSSREPKMSSKNDRVGFDEQKSSHQSPAKKTLSNSEPRISPKIDINHPSKDQEDERKNMNNMEDEDMIMDEPTASQNIEQTPMSVMLSPSHVTPPTEPIIAPPEASLRPSLPLDDDDIMIIEESPKEKNNRIFTYILPFTYQNPISPDLPSEQGFYEIAEIPVHIVQQRLESILKKTKF